MPYDEQDDRDALMPTERGAFEQLPRTRVPSPRLEETTVRALRQRGLLKSVDRSLFRRVASLSAAAMFLFAAGALAGYEAGLRRVAGVRGQPITQPPVAATDTLPAQQ